MWCSGTTFWRTSVTGRPQWTAAWTLILECWTSTWVRPLDLNSLLFSSSSKTLSRSQTLSSSSRTLSGSSFSTSKASILSSLRASKPQCHSPSSSESDRNLKTFFVYLLVGRKQQEKQNLQEVSAGRTFSPKTNAVNKVHVRQGRTINHNRSGHYLLAKELVWGTPYRLTPVCLKSSWMRTIITLVLINRSFFTLLMVPRSSAQPHKGRSI